MNSSKTSTAQGQTKSPQEKESTKRNLTDQKNELLFLLSYYTHNKTKAVFALLASFIASGLSLLFPSLTGQLIDSAVAKTFMEHIPEMAAALILIFVIQAIIQYYSSLTLASITEKALLKLRTELYNHILRLEMKFFDQQRIGELLSRITTDVTQIQETFTFTFLQLIRQSIFLIGGILFIVLRSVQLTLPVLALLPLLIVIGLFVGKKLRKLSVETQDASARATTVVEESLQAIISVKSFSNETYEVQRYKEHLSTYYSLAIKSAKLRSLFISFILFAMFGGIAGVLTYGGYLYGQNKISLGDLASFLMYAMFVAGALGSFVELFSQIQRTLGTSVRIREILAREQEKSNFIDSQSTEDIAITHHSNIIFEDVSFTYSGREHQKVLSNVSFEIQSSTRVAFVGKSGAGKSTTAALIQRFYEPDFGTISIGGIPVQNISLNHLRSAIGVVPQDIILFGGTIEENILYGKPNATRQEVLKACQLANALEFIDTFPDGLQTVVGERGTKLSGGQRQRIAIARVILKDPPILIFDEATSSLDVQTEHLIQNAMEELMKNRTTIIIAHRLSTIRRCDAILVFDNGTIAESGTHAELLSDPSSRYSGLLKLHYGLD